MEPDRFENMDRSRSTGRSKSIVREIFSPAGITLNGERPWDIQVRDEGFYQRVLRAGSLGLGESYMDGWWDCRSLDEFFCRLIPTEPDKKLKSNWRLLSHVLKAVIMDRAGKARAFQIGRRHYDLGNELFSHMLDRRMMYSCGYWNNAVDLDEAQEAKLELICRKLGLRPGMRVLDIGCGWGGLARHAALKYRAEVVGVTVSREQAELAREICRGLLVEIRLQDYRELKGSFDRIVSVGMLEHVGYKNYRTYMETARRCLKDGGLFLLHTIGNNLSGVTMDPWFERYIFPNSIIPSMKQISASAEGLFVIEDWHNFGADYDMTLMAWFRNFDSNWEKIRHRYDERFYRMWKYYLLVSAGLFRSRQMQVWQIVLSKEGVPGGYHRHRAIRQRYEHTAHEDLQPIA